MKEQTYMSQLYKCWRNVETIDFEKKNSRALDEYVNINPQFYDNLRVWFNISSYFTPLKMWMNVRMIMAIVSTFV